MCAPYFDVGLLVAHYRPRAGFESYMGEVMMSCEKIRWIVEQGEKSLSPESRHVPALLFLKKAQVVRLSFCLSFSYGIVPIWPMRSTSIKCVFVQEYYPLGVIGIIIPWNYPVHNAISAAVAAIFAGNGAVVKVSEVRHRKILLILSPLCCSSLAARVRSSRRCSGKCWPIADTTPTSSR